MVFVPSDYPEIIFSETVSLIRKEKVCQEKQIKHCKNNMPFFIQKNIKSSFKLWYSLLKIQKSSNYEESSVRFLALFVLFFSVYAQKTAEGDAGYEGGRQLQ